MNAGAHGAAEAIDTRIFRGFQTLVRRESGINLTDAKKALLVGRLSRRLRELALPSFKDYLHLVEEDESERIRMLDAIATNETHFLREPRQFDFLELEIFPLWEREAAEGTRKRRLRVWSAGCSTGEEPYSLGMLLLSAFPRGWELDILATDLSTKALDRARAAVWPIEKASEVPPRFLKAFMLRGTGPEEGRMKAGPELRALVRFERMNLAIERYAVGEPFDAIFCRNVLIYFDAEGKRSVIGRLLDHLASDGLFFVGHAESLSGITDRVRGLMPSVYTARGVGAPRRVLRAAGGAA